jgi:hypothetical protein
MNINEPNDKLTERFNIERNLRICCAIELDKDNNIIIDQKSPCLYCSFPLIGSESFELPFIINSPDFEPDSERQTILLDGNDINEETGKISDPGINKMILLRIIKIYKEFLDYLCYLCKKNIRKRYFLIIGINSIPQINFLIENGMNKILYLL